MAIAEAFGKKYVQIILKEIPTIFFRHLYNDTSLNQKGGK